MDRLPQGRRCGHRGCARGVTTPYAHWHLGSILPVCTHCNLLGVGEDQLNIHAYCNYGRRACKALLFLLTRVSTLSAYERVFKVKLVVLLDDVPQFPYYMTFSSSSS